MKKINILLLALLLSSVLVACGPETQKVELLYGETYSMESDKLAEYESLIWESEDAEIANVDNGVITATGPGSTVVVAKQDEKVVAKCNVTVKVIPVTNIVLSTNNLTLVEEETYQLSYTLFPDNASDYGLKWQSANDGVAVVESSGVVVGKSAGQTTISVSNVDGLIATCSVTVEQKAAYERLSAQEKTFVDLLLKHIDQFKNPDSVVVKEVEKQVLGWAVKISAQNGFGGNNTTVYYLDDTLGFWNWESADIDMDIDMKHDSSLNVSLINEAISEKR